MKKILLVLMTMLMSAVFTKIVSGNFSPERKLNTTELNSRIRNRRRYVSRRRFYNNQNGTITDSRTSLIWSQNGNPLGRVTWKTAVKYCKKLRLATRNHWRLPTISELKKLVRHGYYPKSRYLQNQGFLNIQTTVGYWTSSEYAANQHKVWGLIMYKGTVFFDYKTRRYYVLAVHDGGV